MDLKYDVYNLQNAVGSGESRQYVRLIQQEPMTTQELESAIQERCSLTRGDVAAVLSELHDLCVQSFKFGRRFYIPGIGYFSLSAGLEIPESNPDKKITAKEVRITGINFRPETKLLKEVSLNTTFVRDRHTTQSPKYSEEKLWAKLKDFLKDESFITCSTFRFISGLTQYSAQKWLLHFCSKGLLVKDGPQKSPIYRLKEK